MNKNEVFDLMVRKGYSKIEVEYSGGNDEGGVDEIKVYDNEGKELDVKIEEASIASTWNPETHRWEGRELAEDEKLAEALVKPVYDEYSSFAGDFDCYGVVTWDAVERKVVMDDHIKSDYDYSSREL